MPWTGSGTFQRVYSWVTDAAAGINITASRMDADTNDITINGLGNVLTRDGQGSATANQPMNGFRHTGASPGVADTDYTTIGQIKGTTGSLAISASTITAATTITAPTITASANMISTNRLSAGTAGVTSADHALIVTSVPLGTSFVVAGDGTVGVPATVGFTTGAAANAVIDGLGILRFSTSSARYKRNIQPFPAPLAAARKLRAVRFQSRAESDGDTVFAGLVAEDVHDAGLTEFVAYDTEGRPNGIHYGPLAALAIGAVSELYDIVDDLRHRVAALEAKQ